MAEYLKRMEENLPYIEGKQKILFINNKDSFVYNLVNYICIISDAEVKVVGNDIEPADVKRFNPDKIVISPGPGHPKYDSGNTLEILREFSGKLPILGVCLGHQAICEAFGEDQSIEYVGRARVGPMHGKLSKTFHDGEDLFEGIPNPLMVVRYHSLAAKADILPSVLKITAMADDGTIMAVKHKEHPTYGVQFHPESIMMKPYGLQILANFIKL